MKGPRDTPAAAAAASVAPAPAAAARFPIVGLGASAGGLEALEHFLHAMPPDSGLGFVVVQHLDPSHASILSEILQRSTEMPVVEAQDQIAVEPNHVYIIPPNRDLAIFRGRLQLSEPAEPRGQRLPIDAFFRSLAEDQGENAIGIVLSGSGSDGTLGLRAIFGAGGLCLAQDPTTAQYASMPASAIAAGYANQVLPVERMPQALRRAALALSGRAPNGPSLPPSGLARIVTLLRLGCGHDFSQYKPSTVNRRIERRMVLHGIDDPEVYARHLKQNPAELQTLFREMLINVTSFFRDPQAFAALKTDLLRDLLAAKPEGEALRIWVAGCATGEESYSIAILLRELLDELQVDVKLQFYSTDLDEDAIAVARIGLYPLNIAQDLTPERLRRYFTREPDGYRVKKEIREMVVFAVQSVTRDPPFTRLDLMVCRNLLIYLQPELQDRLIRTFHYVLRAGGALMLSPSESVGRHTDLFDPVSRKWKLYRAKAGATTGRGLPGSSPTWAVGIGADQPLAPRARPREQHIADLARRALLQAYAPASVVTDLQGDLLYVHGETGRYLRPAPGQPTRSVVEMARDGLQLELRDALVQARQGVPVLARPLQVQLDGHLQPLKLSVRPLAEAGETLNMLLVSFQDQPEDLPLRRLRKPRGSPSSQAQAQLELERELAFARQSMSALVEEQQLSNEELKSTNEELQSTNEELQSTNEEMETSREELQSVNEELVTVNSELQVKIEQMADMQDDMKNLLDNIRVGTIFLDRQLKIRRFTRDATRVFRLVATDVGRSLADIRSDLEGECLLADAQKVLETLAPLEREIRTAAGTWYLARIQPYRTVDDLIDGVVLTFTDVTERVHALASRKALALAEAIVDALREPLLVLDAQLQVLSANLAFHAGFGVGPEATVGRRVFDIGLAGWDVPALHELLETRLPREREFEHLAVDVVLPAAGINRLWLSARQIADPDGGNPIVLLAVEPERGSPRTLP